MAVRLGRGNVFGGGLTSEQRRILERIEGGELTAAQAERLLLGVAPEPRPVLEEPELERPDETPEEAAARELVERIAQQVDAERKR